MNRAERRALQRGRVPSIAGTQKRSLSALHHQVTLRANSSEPLTEAAIYRVLAPTGMRLNELREGRLDHTGIIDLHYGFHLGIYLVKCIQRAPGDIDVAQIEALLPIMRRACKALYEIAERAPKTRKFIGTGDEYRQLDEGYQVLDAALNVAQARHLERAHWSAADDVLESVKDFNRLHPSELIPVPDFVTHNPGKYQLGMATA